MPDDFTWQVALLSAVISAVTSGLVTGAVSLLIAPRKSIWERRAERRDAARESLREAVNPILAKVVKCRAGLLRLDRQPDRLDHSDFQLASNILMLSANLHWIRRALVRRRARVLFGPFIARVASVAPSTDDNFLGPLLAIHAVREDPSRVGLSQDDAHFGVLHTALLPDADPSALPRLERELRRLSAGW